MLKEDWKKFIQVAFNPIIIFLTMSVIFLTYFLTQNSVKESPFQVLVSVTISVLSGVIGNRFFAKMQKYEGDAKLITRGQSAIRGLSIILSSINNFSIRIRLISERVEEESKNPRIIERNFEEFVDKCISLKEQTINAIEEWKDIVPDADISKLHQNFTKLERERVAAEEKIQILQNQISEAKGDVEKVKIQLSEAKKERDKVKLELEEQRLENPISRASVLSGSPLYVDKLEHQTPYCHSNKYSELLFSEKQPEFSTKLSDDNSIFSNKEFSSIQLSDNNFSKKQSE